MNKVLNFLKIPFLYSFVFIFTIYIGTLSDDYSDFSAISKDDLLTTWNNYFAGLVVSFFIIFSTLSFFKKNLNQFIFLIIKLRNAFFSSVLRAFRSKLYNNFSFTDLFILLIIAISLFLSIGAIFHYLETSDVVGQRINDRYYISITTQTLFLITSICSFFQIIKKTKFLKISYVALFLGTFTQAFVDHSRFFAFSFALMAIGFLFKESNLNNRNKQLLLNKKIFTIKKTNIIRISIIVAFLIFLLIILSSRFSRYTALLNYFTSASFYNLGIENINPNSYNYQNLFISLTGLPLKSLEWLGIDYQIFRIDKFRPLTGILQLYVLNSSIFWSGAISALILSPVITLLRYVKSNIVRLFCLLLLFSTIVTLPQYDLRSTLRILQILSLTCLFSLEIDKEFLILKKT